MPNVDISNDEMVSLIYNDDSTKRVEVNRQVVAKSCFFLERLLTGPFIESTLKEINIFFPKDISFKSFKTIIYYATDDIFIRSKDFELHFQTIQLARLWLYDELVDIIEAHLAYNISTNTIFSFSLLALMMNLKVLSERCTYYYKQFELLLGKIERRWGRCPYPGHQTHHYANCKTKKIRYYYETEEEWSERNVDISIMMEEIMAESNDSNSGSSSIITSTSYDDNFGNNDSLNLSLDVCYNYEDDTDEDLELAEKLNKIYIKGVNSFGEDLPLTASNFLN